MNGTKIISITEIAMSLCDLINQTAEHITMLHICAYYSGANITIRINDLKIGQIAYNEHNMFVLMNWLLNTQKSECDYKCAKNYLSRHKLIDRCIDELKKIVM